MKHPKSTICCKAFPPVATALECIAAENLKVPSKWELNSIMHHAILVTKLFYDCCVLEPSDADQEEFFREFIVRSVNRPSGMTYVASH